MNLLCAFSVSCASLFSPQVLAAPKDLVRIAILDTIDPHFFVWTFGETMEYLRNSFPDKKIESVELSFQDLEKAIEAKQIDFFIAPSGFFAFVSESSGASHIATYHQDLASDPGRSVGSVFISRADDKRFNSIKDISEAVLSATEANSFDGWIIATGELLARGLNVEAIEKRAIFTGYGLPDVITLLLNGAADIGVLKACELERLEASGAILPKSVKVIGEKKSKGLSCKVSTDLYPDVVFASLPRASSSLVKDVSVALLTMPKANGGQWGFSNNFNSVTNLYRSLKIGPYEYLRETTPKALMYRYRYELTALLTFLALIALYIVTVNRVVRIRTRDLREALVKKELAQQEARQTEQRIFQLEKAGVVQELSSLFAHESHQPIASLINYADGLKMYFSGKNKDPIVEEALSEISSQAQRLSEIVNRVRSYAKKSNRERKPVNLSSVMQRAYEYVLKTRSSEGVKFILQPEKDSVVYADALEIELVVVNLIKNSLAALQNAKEKLLVLSITGEGSFWKLSVSDNGQNIDEETFRRLCEPITSTKADGLGLGLSICKVIAESHAGKISFERVKPHGLRASILLPKYYLDGDPHGQNK